MNFDRVMDLQLSFAYCCNPRVEKKLIGAAWAHYTPQGFYFLEPQNFENYNKTVASYHLPLLYIGVGAAYCVRQLCLFSIRGCICHSFF